MMWHFIWFMVAPIIYISSHYGHPITLVQMFAYPIYVRSSLYCMMMLDLIRESRLILPALLSFVEFWKHLEKYHGLLHMEQSDLGPYCLHAG